MLQEESSADAKVAVLSFTFGELFVNNITQTFKVTDNEFEMTSIEIQLTFDDENFPNAQDDGRFWFSYFVNLQSLYVLQFP